MKSISLVAPNGTKIADGIKTIEVRSWTPDISPDEDLLIIENKKFLRVEGDVDPEGYAVAVVRVVKVRDFEKDDISAACATAYTEGYYSWELSHVRKILTPFVAIAKRGIYETPISNLNGLFNSPPLTITKPQFVIDENLRFNSTDPNSLSNYIDLLKTKLNETIDSTKRVSLMGEVAVYLRILNRFVEAETLLHEAIEIISTQKLGITIEVQQKIRLAHVWQEKKDFNRSNVLFSELIKLCRESVDARVYLDFALQHAGKNYFDQNLFQVALNYFSEALEIRLKKNSPHDQIESTQNAIQVTLDRIPK